VALIKAASFSFTRKRVKHFQAYSQSFEFSRNSPQSISSQNELQVLLLGIEMFQIKIKMRRTFFGRNDMMKYSKFSFYFVNKPIFFHIKKERLQVGSDQKFGHQRQISIAATKEMQSFPGLSSLLRPLSLY